MLVDGASSVARRLKFPETMISFTVIAFGISLPRLFTILLAAYNGYDDLVMGTILGSSILNLLGILSIVGFFRPIRVNKNTASIGVLSLIVSALLVFVIANYPIITTSDNGFYISKGEGIILLIAFVIFMTYGYFNVKKHQTIWFDEVEKEPSYYVIWFSVLLVFVGIIGLTAGGVLVIDNLIDISRKYNMSQRFLGQFVLSVGGSFVMLYWIFITQSNKSKFETSNLLGQNMLNLLGILGVAAFIQPIRYNVGFNTDILILISVTILIAVMLWAGRKLTLNLWKCRTLFLLLILYILYLFWR